MKNLFLILLLLLSSCAASFDRDVYTKMVMAKTTLTVKNCSDPVQLKKDIDNFYNQIDYLYNFEQGLPSESDNTKMLSGIEDEATRFSNVINNSKTPINWTYCNEKITGIHHTMSLVIKAEGSKND